MARQREPLYEPNKSFFFAFFLCSSRLCKEGPLGTKKCSINNRCLFNYGYDSAVTDGLLASETFIFYAHRKVAVAVTFGCGELTVGSLVGASGIMCLGPTTMSFVWQLPVRRFSYFLTPFANRKPSHLFFGVRTELHRYNSTGEIQTTSILMTQHNTRHSGRIVA
jgi:hypothetical protein